MHEGVLASNIMHELLAIAKFVAIGCRPDAADQRRNFGFKSGGYQNSLGSDD